MKGGRRASQIYFDKILLYKIEMSIKKINGFRIFLNQRLGKGSYGAVFKGESVETKEPCAVKIIDKTNIDSDPYLKNALISQIKIMKALRSDNIVSFIDVMESNNNYYIIQELCTGDLEGYLKTKPGKSLGEMEAIQALTQICNGFMTLVRQGIVHRDLKPANILIANGKMKIGDFGFAKKNVTQKLKHQSAVGTPLYMSVQLLKGEPYTSKCDIWAIGFIFYEILHGHTPWTARSEFELVNNILNKPLKISPNFSEQTVDFLKRTLQPNEQNRISWDDLFRHEIFAGYFKKYTQQNEKLENVYKKVMSDLRFRVNSQNIHLKNLWESLGYDETRELNRKQFGDFLRLIHPSMASTEEQYFFEKMDANGDGNISLNEVSAEFEKNSIPLASVFGNKLPFMLKKLVSIEEDPEEMGLNENSKINPELEKKIQNCFNRLKTILEKKSLTLYKVYNAYDGDKSGQLDFIEFSKIIKRLDPSFSQEELEGVFELVDTDNSKTIEFNELNSYYCKIIGMPEALFVSEEERKAEMEKKNSYYLQQKKALEG